MRMTPGAPWFRLSPFGAGSGGATTALDNLAAVAINATLLPGTDGAVDLGSATKEWGNLFLKSGGTINFNNADVVITHSTDKLAFTGAASGYTFDNPVVINTTASLSIGGVTAFSEQFGASAAGATEALGMFNTTAGTQAEFMFYRSKNASIGSATVVASGDGLGKITWYGAQQTGTFATQNPAAQIRAEVDGVVTSGAGGDMPGRIIFSTTADASGTLTDRLILDALGTLKPNANDGVALGNTTLMFSDLFLAAGAVVNFNNGNMTLTHGTGTLTFAGGDVILGGGATASLLKFLEPSGSGSNFSAFKAVAQSADITYSLPPTVAAAGGVLTDVSGNGVLTWVVPSAGGSTTPQCLRVSDYSASGRNTTDTIEGTGAATYGTVGLSVTTGGTAGSCVRPNWGFGNSNNYSYYYGSPTVTMAIVVSGLADANVGEAYLGQGSLAISGAGGHTFTNRHAGFKIIGAGVSTSLYATQSDNTTENASAALTTLAAADVLDLIYTINSTTSIDYYWRKNEGALSSATNLTSNMPTTSAIASSGLITTSISNKNTANTVSFSIQGSSYKR